MKVEVAVQVNENKAEISAEQRKLSQQRNSSDSHQIKYLPPS